VLDFYVLTFAPREEVAKYFRYMPDQAAILTVDSEWLNQSLVENATGLEMAISIAVGDSPDQVSMLSKLSKEEAVAFDVILANQEKILLLPDRPAWYTGRIEAVASVLNNISKIAGDALAGNLISESSTPTSDQCASLLERLHNWINKTNGCPGRCSR
jgi:hypothetical protein